METGTFEDPVVPFVAPGLAHPHEQFPHGEDVLNLGDVGENEGIRKEGGGHGGKGGVFRPRHGQLSAET